MASATGFARATIFLTCFFECVLQGHDIYCGDFAETTVFERYGVKTSENVTKGICIQVQRWSKPTHDHAASL